ncbi:MAG: hypothetical protein WKF77_09930 [Planctomycetaceae bacterium]
MSALNSLLQVQKDDSARLHFRIATLLKPTDRESARRHVLLSLAQAPRYRDAHRLLLELVQEPAAEAPSEPPADAEAPRARN